MGRSLTNLEKKALFGNVGRQEKEFLVCAIRLDEFVDAISSCTDREHISIPKKTLKERFPKDEIKVLISKTRRIE